MEHLVQILFGSPEGLNLAAFWLPLLAAAALTAGKTVSGNLAAAEQRDARGEMMKYAPWTGVDPGPAHQDQNAFGNMADASAFTFGMAQGMEKPGVEGIPSDRTRDHCAWRFDSSARKIFLDGA